ncbi:uncharacterized protein EV422DRAFT_612251 [Fimicolochytrium jonesii]|uniref:uncharacterized protein n=1 Tax=Fimicolochytrium jonesii TaxID=1396493 RepID=UPI0022FE0890|nr:uncharacterized protein EV422DRAFT_612251 [Fimicolochytrium jonesii]KAI8823733.1 hypothetical protein EV422DRAFT_612251 [Fimicolochytrium jonesii]
MNTSTSIGTISIAYQASQIPYVESSNAFRNDPLPIRQLNWRIYHALYAATANDGAKIKESVQETWECNATEAHTVHALDHLFESVKVFLTTMKAVGGATPRSFRCASSPVTNPSSNAASSSISDHSLSRRSSSARSTTSSRDSRDAPDASSQDSRDSHGESVHPPLSPVSSHDPIIERDGRLKTEALRRETTDASPAEVVDANRESMLQITEAVYIVPFGISRVPGVRPRFETALPLFGHGDLDLDKVDVVSNIVTLGPSEQHNFAQFYWIVETHEATESGIVYTITHLRPEYGPRYRCADPTELERMDDGEILLVDGTRSGRPDPKFFDLHAKIGKVLHASGLETLVDNVMKIGQGHELGGDWLVGISQAVVEAVGIVDDFWIEKAPTGKL